MHFRALHRSNKHMEMCDNKVLHYLSRGENGSNSVFNFGKMKINGNSHSVKHQQSSLLFAEDDAL